MPTILLVKEELELLAQDKYQDVVNSLLINGKTHNDFKEITGKKSISKVKLEETLPYLDQRARNILSLRDTDKISEAKRTYQRR